MSATLVRTPDNPRGMRDLPFRLPEVTMAQKRRARAIYDALEERYPNAECALDYTQPHELLVATILSAQATDVGVNKATPALFAAFPEPADYASATPKRIEPYVRTIGLFRNKSKHIHGAMTALIEEHGGEVPTEIDALLALPGVARKTANVVLGDAFGIRVGVVVDTHVERLSKRFALAPEDATVAMVERHLMARLPRAKWTKISHMLILHGRAVCKARGASCDEDEICRKYCAYSKELRRAERG
ncbi:MAG: endonuclease III [Planctomycetota bacterium]